MDWPRICAAEGGLMSHKCCHGLCEMTLLYFRCQTGWICDRSTEHQLESQKVSAIPENIFQFIIHGCERQHTEHLSSADTINANLQAVQAG